MTKADAEARIPNLSLDAIDISFDAVPGAEERRYFMSLPTSFPLPADAVNHLRELGGRLLRESGATQALLRQIEASGAPTLPPTGSR